MEQRDGATWVTNPAEPLWPEDGSPRLEFELEQVFGVDEEPEEALLASIRDIAVDDAGRVYILDEGDNRLVAFAPSGEVLWSDGRPGEGPGEIEEPASLVWNGSNRVHLANQNGMQIDTWSTDGEYLDSVLLADVGVGRVSTLGFVPPGTAILLGFPRTQTQGHTLAADKDWALGKSFMLAAAKDVPQPAGASVGADSAIAGESIVFGNVFDHEFRTFHTDGRPDLVVARTGTDFIPAAIDLERGAVGSLGSVGAPARLADGSWLVHAHWPTNISDPILYLRRALAGERVRVERHHAIDLFDAEGRWLTGRTWDHPDRPPFGYLRSIGPDGKVYSFVADPFPQIRRYRLVVRPPG